MHGQGCVGEVAAAHAGDGLEGDEVAGGGGGLVLPLLLLLLLLRLLLVVRERAARECGHGELARLQGAAVVAAAVVVEAVADHLAALDDDAAVAVLERGAEGLLQAQVLVIVRLHCECCCLGVGVESGVLDGFFVLFARK